MTRDELLNFRESCLTEATEQLEKFKAAKEKDELLKAQAHYIASVVFIGLNRIVRNLNPS